MIVTKDGWLEAEAGDPDVKLFPTERTTRLVTPKPVAIIWHYTGGLGGPEAAERLARLIQPYVKGDERSWHVLVGRDGRVYQSARFLQGTWHVGLPGKIGGTSFLNVNRCTVGVELQNAGQLRQVGGQFYCWPYWHRDPEGAPEKSLGVDPRLLVDADRVVLGDFGAFEGFPEAQVMSATLLLKALVATFGWKRDVCSYGHVDFKPKSGKVDPGPHFSGTHLPKILDDVFGRASGGPR